MSSLFGSQPPKPSGLFSSLVSSQPQQTSSLFGQPQQQQQSGGPFSTSTQQQQQPSGLFGLLGPTQQQQQPTSSLFSGSIAQKPTSSLFGPIQQPQQQQTGTGLFGQSTAQQPTQPLFGTSQQQVAPLPSLSRASIWQPQTTGPREKPIQEQIEFIAKRWAPEHPDCAFQTYLYNAVPEAELPFFAPSPGEDERKWEEALQKRPTPNSVPVLARGFEMLGLRMKNQNEAAQLLRTRLHDIHKCLEARLQKHDTETTVRARKARQKHQALSRRCLALATRVQVLRNRGYALDRTEEELRAKLTELEKQAFDPVLNGRQEEIWARMAVVRERAEMIQVETKRLGDKMQEGAQDEQLMTEKEKETIKKILTDYDSQLAHLAKEVDMIKRDLEDWESMTKTTNGTSVSR